MTGLRAILRQNRGKLLALTTSITVVAGCSDSLIQLLPALLRGSSLRPNGPMIECPGNLSVNCASSRDSIERWLAAAAPTSTCRGATVVTTFAPTSQPCELNVTWVIHDECGRASCSALLNLTDSDPPILTLIGRAEVTIECQPGGYLEEGATVDDCDPSLTEAVVSGDRVLDTRPGTYVVSYAATDVCGNVGRPLSRTVHVVDTLPPRITIDPNVQAWPPNHRYMTFNLSDLVKAHDLC